MKHTHRAPRAGRVAPLLAALGIVVVAGGCRSKVEEERRDVIEARQEAREVRDQARKDADEMLVEVDGHIAEADAEVAEEEQELHAALGTAVEGARSVEEDHLSRVDSRLLELQARINELAAGDADPGDYESTWEELDRRRTTLRRTSRSVSTTGAGDVAREEERRTLRQQVEELEADVESAIDEVEARLSRG